MPTKIHQIDLIKADLLNRQPVNAVVAFNQHHITRLAAIIKRLRERGWPIYSGRQNGNGLADYSLVDGWQPVDTKKPQ